MKRRNWSSIWQGKIQGRRKEEGGSDLRASIWGANYCTGQTKRHSDITIWVPGKLSFELCTHLMLEQYHILTNMLSSHFLLPCQMLLRFLLFINLFRALFTIKKPLLPCCYLHVSCRPWQFVNLFLHYLVSSFLLSPSTGTCAALFSLLFLFYIVLQLASLSLSYTALQSYNDKNEHFPPSLSNATSIPSLHQFIQSTIYY